MRAISTLLCASAAILMLSGCVEGGLFDNYDGYYDGYYGPYGGGYWASDGFFYYGDGQHGFHRDDGGHFRHERFSGGTPFRGERRGDGRDSHDRDNRGRDRH